jgi:hypothetical protein
MHYEKNKTENIEITKKESSEQEEIVCHPDFAQGCIDGDE